MGYKVHSGVEADTLLVRKAVLAPAKLYERQLDDELVSGDERAWYRHKAYQPIEWCRRLKSSGIKDRIVYSSHTHQRKNGAIN